SGSIGASAGPYTTWSDGEGKDGVSATKRTTILGYRRHAVTIDGGGKLYPLFLFKAQHVEVGNIVALHAKLEGENSQDAVHLEQTLDIYLHQIGAAYPDPTCDNCMGIGVEVSSDVTIEECWTWGFGARYGILLHGGLRNVARRNVTRYDGAVDGNPKAALALYSEDQSIAENNVTVDYDAGSDTKDDVHAPFFTTSSVTLTPPTFPPGLPAGLKTVSWYGNVAINTILSPEAVFFFDSLASVGGTITAIDNIAGNGGAPFAANDDGFGMWVSHDEGTPHSSITLNHNTIYGVKVKNGVQVDAPPAWSAITFDDNLIGDLTGTNSTCFKDESGNGKRITATGNEVFQCASTVPNDATLSVTDPKLSFLTSVASGAPGATVVKRYVGGVLSNTNLWPFPNEDSIKSDLCMGPDGTSLNGTPISTRTHNASGWCTSGKTLTQYVWGQLGHASPY
ncbi:MAG TPA: hypothetical protein VH560_00480, partial [Polyangia bacterium]|nr:hypothetical protein [Polyangia bacterium]